MEALQQEESDNEEDLIQQEREKSTKQEVAPVVLFHIHQSKSKQEPLVMAVQAEIDPTRLIIGIIFIKSKY